MRTLFGNYELPTGAVTETMQYNLAKLYWCI